MDRRGCTPTYGSRAPACQTTARGELAPPGAPPLAAASLTCRLLHVRVQEVTSADSSGAGACHKFISTALPHLVPLLLAQLVKQEEGQETEDGAWNLSMAAGTCLGLCAATVGDAVVPLVMPYVQVSAPAAPRNAHLGAAAG